MRDTPATLIVRPTLGRLHKHVAQCCRNIQPFFSKCLGIHKICLGFKRIHRNVDNKYFKKSKNSEKNKIMIWGIHYFITKLKTKIDVIPKRLFKSSKGFGGNDVGPASQNVAQHYRTIGPMYLLSGWWPFWRRATKVSPTWQLRQCCAAKYVYRMLGCC